MSRYVRVLPYLGEKSFDRLFTYRLPEHLASTVEVGGQVLVPFGPRLVPGFVIELADTTDWEDAKPVAARLEGAPPLSSHALALAHWIADYYCCSLGEAARPLLPESRVRKVTQRVTLCTDACPADPTRMLIAAGAPTDDPRHAAARRLLQALRAAGGTISLTAAREAAGPAVMDALALLAALGFIEQHAQAVAPKTRAKIARIIELAISPAEAEALAAELEPKRPRPAAVLRAVIGGASGMTSAELARQAGVGPAVVRGLVTKGVLRESARRVWRDPWGDVRAAEGGPHQLNAEQEPAAAALREACNAGEFAAFLLFGVTASGKTEVYLHAIEAVIAQGRQAIVLVPEISLTAQVMAIFRARFGDRVAILHSALSPGERFDELHRIAEGEADVVVGARSAVFAPCPRLGLIVVDEEHETSYKQEHSPRYHAREVALKRGELEGAVIVLSSATPSLETFRHAEEGRFRLLRLSARIDGRSLPTVETINLKRYHTPGGILSPQLCQAIREVLAARQQVILFLNRRGFSTVILCPDCGRTVHCPHCRVSLTYHRAENRVLCHHCGFAEPAPEICPGCGGAAIRLRGYGTEKVETEIRRYFPDARIGRLDRDTTARKGSHLRIVDDFRSQETDILIGTQMVAKGFDFPQVTLVGVINADVALNLPDFRSAERTFQLIAQVSGRSGRGDQPGRVIVQTYHPEHYGLVAAAGHDYESFYAQEIDFRREPTYPPFARLANILITTAKEADAKTFATDLAARYLAKSAEMGDAVEVLGPVPAPLSKVKGKYRWHLLLRAATHEALTGLIRATHAELTVPRKISLAVDIDPVSLM